MVAEAECPHLLPVNHPKPSCKCSSLGLLLSGSCSHHYTFIFIRHGRSYTQGGSWFHAAFTAAPLRPFLPLRLEERNAKTPGGTDPSGLFKKQSPQRAKRKNRSLKRESCCRTVPVFESTAEREGRSRRVPDPGAEDGRSPSRSRFLHAPLPGGGGSAVSRRSLPSGPRRGRRGRRLHQSSVVRRPLGLAPSSEGGGGPLVLQEADKDRFMLLDCRHAHTITTPPPCRRLFNMRLSGCWFES